MKLGDSYRYIPGNGSATTAAAAAAAMHTTVVFDSLVFGKAVEDVDSSVANLPTSSFGIFLDCMSHDGVSHASHMR